MANIERGVLPGNDKVCKVGDGVFAVDTDYVRPRQDASHLVVDSGKAAFVDTGTNHSVANLEAALRTLGLDALDVEYLFLTHVHLDHAGGAGLLAQRCPRAQVLVHPRGAPHLIDPAKLIAGTRAVYGDAAYQKMYGDIRPIPAERVSAMQDGEERRLGARSFRFLHTPGHALHHLCIVEQAAGVVFSGDTYGVSYREFDNDNGEFVMVTTTPTQFDPEQLHASVRRIQQLRPRSVYMTHYSRVDQVQRLGEDLHADIDRHVAIALAHAVRSDREERIRADLQEHFERRLERHGYVGGERQRHMLLDDDVALNATGLVSWLSRRAA
ncbi:MAG: MBL fold metallo-hydrolase [Proteobacteria bacterium]|nr:MBL fold metallo-hydrolase [Pseudomonadota bacterium]